MPRGVKPHIGHSIGIAGDIGLQHILGTGVDSRYGGTDGIYPRDEIIVA